MGDKTIWGCAETGTFYQYGNPDLLTVLSGTAASGFAIAQPFSAALSDGDTATISIIKDASHWAVYEHATFHIGDLAIFDCSYATLLASAGGPLTNGPVTVLGLAPVPALTEVLTDDRTYYVGPSGSDDFNSGLTADQPFASIQRAVDVAAGLVIGNRTVTVSVADGNYYGQVLVPAIAGNPINKIPDRGNIRWPLKIVGNRSTPANVTLQGEFPFAAEGPGARCHIEGIKIQGDYRNISVSDGAAVDVSDVVFGGNVYHGHVVAARHGSVTFSGGCAISAGSTRFARAESGGSIELLAAATVTLSGTPAFSEAFASVAEGGLLALRAAITFSGTGTGKRYAVATNGVILSNGVTLPGSVAGTTATGGQYA